MENGKKSSDGVPKGFTPGSKYEIFPEQFRLASFYGVEIKPSEKKKRKIDVFKNGELLCSVGAINFVDIHQLSAANTEREIILDKREKYLKRHQYDYSDESLYSMRLLW